MPSRTTICLTWLVELLSSWAFVPQSQIWRLQTESLAQKLSQFYINPNCRVPFEAKSMSELRQKVSAGAIKPITPGKYSLDLVLTMQSLLHVTPSKRATIEKILASPGVQKRLGNSKPSVSGPSESHLIGTIKVFAHLHPFTFKYCLRIPPLLS